MKVTKEEIRNAAKESLKHWKRMQRWVKKQPPENKVNKFLMFQDIAEMWYGFSCALCNLFSGRCQCHIQEVECPINPWCLNELSAWRKVNEAITWNEWLRASEGMIKELERVIRRC